MENLGCQTTEKKSLMNSFYRLNETANKFDKLERLSEILVEKFERTEDMIKKAEVLEKEGESQNQDIIDLFNCIDNRLNLLLNKIGYNIDKVVNMID